MTSVRTSSCQAGFAVGETFTGTGRPGEIARISPDGSTALIPWVTLPGELACCEVVCSRIGIALLAET